MVLAIQIALGTPVGIQKRVVIGMYHTQTHLLGVRGDAVVQVAVRPQVGHKGGGIFHPLALEGGIRQSFVLDDGLNDIHQCQAVGTSPQRYRRTDKVDTRYGLALQMVGLVVLLDRHTLGRTNHLAGAAVARLVMDVDATIAVYKSRIAVKHAVVRLLAVVEGHVVVSVSTDCELLSLMQVDRKRVPLGVWRVGNVAASTRLRGVADFSADGVVVERKHTDGIVYSL